MKSTSAQRFAFVDYIRGFLVIAMVVYHAVYCFYSFSLVTVDLFTGFWWWFPRCIAAGFLLVSGWSLAASRDRGQTFKKAGRRMLKLAGLALVVSLATYITFGPQYFVFFGILHSIAVASLLSWPLAAPAKKSRTSIVVSSALILLGGALLAAGLWLGTKRFDFPWLAWLGFRPADLYPVDFEPLLPWLSWFVFGIALYPASKGLSGSLANTGAKPGLCKPMPAALAFLGRHSLIIYLAHLPALYGLAWLVSALRG